MKKALLSLAVLTTLVGPTFVSAQTTPSITDLLKEASFGYDAQNYIAVDAIDTNSIQLRSPIIKYYNGEPIYIYRLTYSPYLVEDLATTSDPAILDKIKSKEVPLLNGEDRITLRLGTEDGLDPTQNYYAMVTPIDIYDEIGSSSEQICFNLSQQKYDIGDKCLLFGKVPESGTIEITQTGEIDNTQEHGASSTVDLELANISHTINGNVITFHWTAIQGVESMDIFVFDLKQEARTRVTEVKLSAEKYDYTMKRDGEHMFSFKPLNGGREKRYDVNAMRSEEKKETPTITPPATGPMETTLAVLMLSGLIYLGYRKYRIKAER